MRRWHWRVAATMPMVAAAAVLIGLVIGPALAGYRTLTVLSGSMAPNIPVGSMIVTEPVPVGTVQPGDVITFQPPDYGGRVVTHRVIEVDHGGPRPVVRTAGDANAGPDPWHARLEGDTAWRVRQVIPHAGSLLMLLRSRAARVLLLYGGLALFVLASLRALWRRERWAQVPPPPPGVGQYPVVPHWRPAAV